MSQLTFRWFFIIYAALLYFFIVWPLVFFYFSIGCLVVPWLFSPKAGSTSISVDSLVLLAPGARDKFSAPGSPLGI